MLNKVQLIGNLGKDPEVRHLANERSVANFTIATTESWKNKDGERQSKTEWHNCQAWSPLAGIIEKYAKKGQQVYVEGKIVNESYEHEGVTKYKTFIEVREFKLLGKRDGEGTATDSTSAPQQQSTGAPATSSVPTPSGEDDLPF